MTISAFHRTDVGGLKEVRPPRLTHLGTASVAPARNFDHASPGGTSGTSACDLKPTMLILHLFTAEHTASYIGVAK